MKRLYLDHAATTPMAKEVLVAMEPYFTEKFGNAGSLHAFGQEARQAMERARGEIASFIGAGSDEIVFTGSGTESNNLAIKGVAAALEGRGRHIITSVIEHHATTETCAALARQGYKVTYLPVDDSGMVDPDDVRKAITKDTILISIMHANNEIGTIQPLAEIGRVAREYGVYLHTDAVQTLGHIPVNVEELNVDMLSSSAHKLYGPKGVGFLYVRKGTRLHPLVHGGGQERGLRSSTHNVPGIVGFGQAVLLARERMEEEGVKETNLRDRLIAGILGRIEDSRLNGHASLRLPNNVHISIAYVEGEALVLSLDMEGIACSTGSACTSTSLEPSHVLKAIRCPDSLAPGSLRITLGRSTQVEDIDYVLDRLCIIVRRLRAISPLYKQEKGRVP